MRLAQESLKASEKSIGEFNQDPLTSLKKTWDFYLEEKKQKRPPKELQMFTGPTDPAFLIHERQWKEKSLQYSREKIEQLMKVKP
ncbi:hypothetical protein D9M68_893900 [compost metagenome]